MPRPYYDLVVPWLFQNRGEFTLLVHPNTGCEYEDHSIWAQWSGQQWILDMSYSGPGFIPQVGDKVRVEVRCGWV